MSRDADDDAAQLELEATCRRQLELLPPLSLLRALEPAAARLLALTKLDLKHAGLAALPAALHLAAPSLVQLDVGDNPLTTLDGVERLGRLSVLFASRCRLGPALPAGGALSALGALRMVALTANGLRSLDGAALPPSLVWLIAPQNEIREVRSAERLGGVRKLMLSHNELSAEALAPLLVACPRLEMLRVACNRLETLPEALLDHPTLAWLAIGGNPYATGCFEALLGSSAAAADCAPQLEDGSVVAVSDVELGRGSGAVVKRGEWRGTPVAVKQWTASLFSDGDARGEWQMGKLTGGCDALVRTLAAWEAPSLGMAVELLDGAAAVGGPPSFDSVTRDTFTEGKHARLTAAQALHVAATVARALRWLHARGMAHGDVYLHNTLRVPGRAGGADAVPDAVRLSDLGAACAYDRAAHPAVEKLEVRAFGFLVDDLLLSCNLGGERPQAGEERPQAGARILGGLRGLRERCAGARGVATLPTFGELEAELQTLAR